MSYQSPYSNLLWTNYVPSTDDVPQIKAAIKQEGDIIRILDLELAEIDQAITTLTARRTNVSEERTQRIESVAQHQAFLTPARALPLDILAQVFQILAPSMTTTASKLALGQTWKQHPIVKISHVCRRWRDLATSMGVLWSTVSLRHIWNPEPAPLSEEWNGEKNTLNIERTTDMMSAFVKRAAGCPTTIYFSADDFVEGYDEIDQAAVTSLVDTLKGGTWESIHFDLYILTRTSPLLRLLDVPAHSKDTLRRVNLNICSAEQSPALSRAIAKRINLQRAPHLTSLDVDIPGVHLTEMDVNWDALTYLGMGPFVRKKPADLYDLSCSHAFEMLRRCPNLHKSNISIYPVKPLGSTSSSTTPITLANLHTLTFSGHLPPQALANALDLPALRNLSVVDDQYWEARLGNGQEPHSTADSFLCAMLRRNGSQLTDVTFDYGSLTQSALVSCLEALPSVTSLAIMPVPHDAERQLGRRDWGSAAVFDTSLLRRMTPKFDTLGGELVERCICPNLTKMMCTLGPMERNHKDWTELVAARRTPRRGGDVAWLDTVRVKFNHDAKELPQMLKELADRVIDCAGIEFVT